MSDEERLVITENTLQDCMDKLADLRDKVKFHSNRLSNRVEELEKKVEGIYKSVHGIAPNKPDIIIEVLRELGKWIKRYIFGTTMSPPLMKDKLDKLLEKLDSGGEKAKLIVETGQKSIDGKTGGNSPSDSKQPEPKYLDRMRDDVWEALNEPREDECHKCFESMKDYDLVKREDLERIFFIMDFEGFWDEMEDASLSSMKRIKEEYNL